MEKRKAGPGGKGPQGKRWHRLDNTGKIFPLIANQNLSNVFRISVTLKEEVDPEVLEQALADVLPCFPGFQVKLKRGFFWYYFETNKRAPVIEEEAAYPCRYIDPKSSPLFLFRVSYFKRRINLEVFHAVTDGLGAVNFLKELTCRYLQRKRAQDERQKENGRKAASRQSVEDNRAARHYEESVSGIGQFEDSYLKNYRKVRKRRYQSKPAVQLDGTVLEQAGENIIHGCVKVSELKPLCRAKQVSITKYLTAVLIWSIYEEYLGGQPSRKPIGVNLPINLRAFFGSTTASNFFAVTGIRFQPEREHVSLDEILESVSRQMDENIVKEKLEETISYNVSREKKWYVRVIPLFIKWLALGPIFRRNDRANTITLSNVGAIQMDEAYQEEIEAFHMMIGVSRLQRAKCGVCSYGDKMMITFATIFEDCRLADRFFGKLKEDGLSVEMETNGAGKPESGGLVKREDFHWNYPMVGIEVDKWRRLKHIFYGILAAAALVLAVVNAVTYSGFWWAGIAVPGILYTILTLNYSILKHANLGKSVMTQTIGLQILVVMIDWALGFRGWSLNYGVPGMLLFADIAVVFLILVNRMNWQSYLMYQLAITVLSFIPLILWAAGWITAPFLAVVTVILSVLILAMTVLLGDRSVKSEFIRRFHL
ncbi:MAG: DUF6320 domain-containing protein [Lachnospiraceae bacterium]|nr:DUF6320 domain-containing protein [Lachnospiraceae bacterium]